MALAVPTTEPDRFIQGAKVEWTRDLADFPASAWTLTYTFLSPTHTFTVTGVASGDTHAATIASAASLDVPAGEYQWQALADDGAGDVKAIDSGFLIVDRRYSQHAEGFELRSFARRMLELIEARIEGTADRDDLSYSTEGLSVSRYSPEQLEERRSFYRRLVVAEDRKARAANREHHDGRIFMRLP